MKKLFLSFFLLFSGVAFAQDVPNGGFENWTSHGSFSFPDTWVTTDSASYTGFSQHSAVQENSIVHSGSSALKLTTWSVGLFNVAGAATNGALNTTTFQFQGGTPDTVRHEELTGWYQYAPSGSDSATILVTLTRWNGTSSEVVAAGAWSEKNTVNSYTQFTIPLNYSSSEKPDSMLIVILTSAFTGANLGTTLYIDDLHFAGIVSSNDLPEVLASVKAFPNPANDFLTLEAKWKTQVKAFVAVLDANGKLVLNLPLNEERQRIDVSALSNGQYFYELRDEKGARLYTDKFLINR